jgi:hypothetical protein
VDLARFLVVLHPSQEHGFYGHGRFGTDRPEILAQKEPPANHDAHLAVVRDLAPMQDRRFGLF